ncbi:hypothetical protein GWR56_01335 [Mucilaginibacter sp. 14171R-50]|uniref:DUF6122 family protein n=1 Tax=Mucilaginibacter sp. 14171R-50 TaxID=2703789 RepID=UPI00138B9E93|nr:DUF6122 family protein [Mucilaginibacter sp. 14171R-50]QHS54257.1 hypothetical protein GWR56_01335 [Mucilaginibacter sp. 14171R-50]
MLSFHLFTVLRLVIHYGLHFFAPGLLALIFFRKIWQKAWLIMVATMLVDADHLLAKPIFDPTRCSIGFHPLHSYYAIAIYVILLFVPKTRIIAIGLLFHMLADYQDCLWIG